MKRYELEFWITDEDGLTDNDLRYMLYRATKHSELDWALGSIITAEDALDDE